MAQRQRARLITARTQDRNLLSVSIIISHRCIKALEQLFYRRGASAARGAHNSEVTGSTPVAGIISIRLVYRIRPSSWTLNAATVIPVWRRGSALLKRRLLPFYHLWYDLRMVIGLHHRGRRIETYRRYFFLFTSGLDLVKTI